MPRTFAMSGEEEVFDMRHRLKVLRSMIPFYKQYLVPTKIIPDLYPILGEDKRRQILEKERQSREQAVEILMDAVLAEREDGLDHFIYALKQGGAWESFLSPLENSATQADTNSGNQLTNEYYTFLIHCLEGEIIRFITPGELQEILDHLITNSVIDDIDKEDILSMNRQMGLMHLFTIMKQCHEWPLKLFSAFRAAKPELLRKIDPMGESPFTEKNEKTVMGSAENAGVPGRPTHTDTCSMTSDETIPKRPRTSEGASSSVQQDPAILAEGTSDDDAMDTDEEAQLLESDIDEFSDDDKEEKKDDDSEKTGQPVELPMRKYQYELAAPALSGCNTIICAPTGSGKTRVALYIVQQHLQLGTLSDEVPRKVVFLARTVPLVSQQFKIFEKYLPNFRCRLVTGETQDHENLHLMVDDYDILVLTPKILENHLSPDKIPSLSVFSLIIFDECHHTRKGEPYNSVMKNYLQFKKNGEKGLPQIVGLTASIGIEKASTVEKAVQSVLAIMANLDVNSITVVKNNLDELEMTVPKPDEKLIELRPRSGDDISQSIMHNMEEIEKLLSLQFSTQQTDPELSNVSSYLRKRPADRKSQKYGQWAVQIIRKAGQVYIPEVPDPERRHIADLIERRRLCCQNVQLLAEALVAYNEALDVHELTRPVDVLDHLKKKLDPRHPADSPQRTHLESQLCKLFAGLERKLRSSAAAKNPNLSTLSEAITEKLDKQWEASRVMVFVRMRATCQALCNWLNSNNVITELQQLKASPFTGTGAAQDEGGMTQNEQEGVIEKFRAGDVKLLVCTTVGQEGMDIPDCNLVIRYNHVGNEVTTVQTRGRSRKAGGLSMLLAMPDVIKKERINKQLVKIMNQAIKTVNSMRKKEVDNQVLQVQKWTMHKDEMKKKASLKSQSSKMKQGSFTLECGKCRKVRVLGSQIRTIDSSHHVIIGNDLLDNGEVSIRYKDKPKNVDNVQFTGEIICNKCPVTRQNHLGTTLKYQEVEFLTVRAEGWVVLDKDNRVERSGKWKWKDVRYEIPELTARDINTHLGQPQDSSEEEGAAGDSL